MQVGLQEFALWLPLSTLDENHVSIAREKRRMGCPNGGTVEGEGRALRMPSDLRHITRKNRAGEVVRHLFNPRACGFYLLEVDEVKLPLRA